MKKILIGALIALTTIASADFVDYTQDCIKNNSIKLNQVLKNTIFGQVDKLTLEKVGENRYNQTNIVCPKYISNYIGAKASFGLTDKNGRSFTFDSASVCSSYPNFMSTQYTNAMSDFRYSRKLMTLFIKGLYNPKNSEEQQIYYKRILDQISPYRNFLPFFGFNTILDIVNNKEIINNEFQVFLINVLTNNFVEAESIINNQDISYLNDFEFVYCY